MIGNAFRGGIKSWIGCEDGWDLGNLGLSHLDFYQRVSNWSSCPQPHASFMCRWLDCVSAIQNITQVNLIRHVSLPSSHIKK